MAERGTFSGAMFVFAGFVVTNIMGVGDRFAVLLAQASLETGGFQSNLWKKGSGGWCMWYSKTGTPRAIGGNVESSEPVAMYTGWLQYFKMWIDRVQWDERHNIRTGQYQTAQGYAQLVVNANWLGAVAPERKATYVQSWMDVYGRLGTVTRAAGGVSNEPTSKGGGWSLWRILFVCFIISAGLAVIYILLLLIGAFRKAVMGARGPKSRPLKGDYRKWGTSGNANA